MRNPPRLSLITGIIVTLIALAGVYGYARPARAGGVVGDGTPASCTRDALAAAVAGGGQVTFNCGQSAAAPVTIAITQRLELTADTLVDGGNREAIVLDAGDPGADARNGVGIFSVAAGVKAELRNIKLAHAGATAIVNHGTLTLREAEIVYARAGQCAGVESDGTLFLLQNTLITTNAAETMGGGVCVLAGAATVDGSMLLLNSAEQGGGLYVADGAAVTSVSAYFGFNSSRGPGAGLFVAPNAVVALHESAVVGNAAAPTQDTAHGGGVFNQGELTLSGATVLDNQAHAGGGVYNAGTLTVRGSDVLQNVANEATGSGGGLFNSGQALFATSSLVRNRAGQGGGFYNTGELTVRNATVSDNSAGALAAGGVTTIHYSTLVENTPEGLAATGGATHLLGSIVAGCAANGGAITSHGYNLDTGVTCGLAGPGDLSNTDPLLTPLQTVGDRYTWHHFPQAGSPAIDAAEAVCADAEHADQHGYARPGGAACDIGAVEAGGSPPAPTPTPTATPTATHTPTVTPTATPTPTATLTPYTLGDIIVRPIVRLTPNVAAPVNIRADVLEVTQGIQHVSGQGVTLIADKQTYVRFHVSKTLGDPAPIVGARLWRVVNGVRVGEPLRPTSRPGLAFFQPVSIRLPGAATSAPAADVWVFDPLVTVRARPNRNTLEDAFLFRLPASWLGAGDLTLEAEANPTSLNGPAESDRTDNVLRRTVSFTASPPLRLRLVAVTYRAGGNTYTPSSEQMADLESWLRRAYPIAELIVTRDATDMTALNRLPDAAEVNDRLALMRLFYRWGQTDPPQMQYYGLVADGGGYMRGLAGDHVASGPTGRPGVNANPLNAVAWDTDSNSYGDWYGGHELGHTHGRPHVMCNGDEGGAITYPEYPLAENGSIGRLFGLNLYWGFDVALRGRIIYPPTWKDMMTYCANQWISPENYRLIRNFIVAENAAARSQARPAAPTDYLFVQGRISRDLTSATLGALYRLTGDAALTGPAAGEFTLRLRSLAGAILAEHPFAAEPGTEDPHDTTTPLVFSFSVPFPAGTHTIEIARGGQALGARTLSSHAPTVQVTAPAGGEVVGPGGLAAAWQAHDEDGDPLTATLLFSRDGGATYRPLRTELAGSQAAIPLAELAGTSQGKLRVLVSDGVNTAQADSVGVFSVPNRPPAPQILAPAAAAFPFGQNIPLIGFAADPEDGILPGAAFTWRSSRDGLLGAGASLGIETLSVGSHLLTLAATDSAGATASITHSLTISNDVMLPAAVLLAAPGSTSFQGEVGQTTALTQTLSLRSPDDAALAWQATSDAAWLTVTPGSGVTAAEPELRVDPTGLAPGAYQAAVTLTADGLLATQQIHVFLTVAAGPPTRVYLPAIWR